MPFKYYLNQSFIAWLYALEKVNMGLESGSMQRKTSLNYFFFLIHFFCYMVQIDLEFI